MFVFVKPHHTRDARLLICAENTAVPSGPDPQGASSYVGVLI